MSRLVRRLLVGGGLTALLVGAVAAPASAHVSVSSPNATQGGFGVLTFRVPNESDTASTTNIKVQLPQDQPLASVSVKPLPGWTYKVTKKKLDTPIKNHDSEITEVVDTVEFTAAAGNPGIKAGEFQEFQVSAGPLPTVDSLSFKTIQTYSDKSEAAWIEVPTAGGAEPDKPAPTLKLTPAAAEGDGSAAAPANNTDGGTSASKADSDSPSKGSVTVAIVLGIVGVLAGLGGLAFGFTARRRSGALATSVAREETSVT